MGIITLQDKSTTNALFNGEALGMLVSTFKINGSNIVKTTNKTAQPTFVATDGTDNSKFRTAYNRKKVESQYSAFTNPSINIDIIFKNDEKTLLSRGINGEVVNMMTMERLMHFIMTPKTYYLNDEIFANQLSTGLYPYYSTYGIPVVISTWSVSVNSSTGDIKVTLVLNETVDEYI